MLSIKCIHKPNICIIKSLIKQSPISLYLLFIPYFYILLSNIYQWYNVTRYHLSSSWRWFIRTETLERRLTFFHIKFFYLFSNSLYICINKIWYLITSNGWYIIKSNQTKLTFVNNLNPMWHHSHETIFQTLYLTLYGLFQFNVISTFLGYLMPKASL